MTLTQVRIPGFQDQTALDEWLQSLGTFHPAVSVRPSSLGGNGLFFDASVSPSLQGNKDTIRLATIEDQKYYDYDNLLKYLSVIKSSDAAAAKVITSILTNFDVESETDLLICYWVGFHIIQQAFPNSSVVAKLEKVLPYLNVLAHTDTLRIGQADAESNGQASGDEDFTISLLKNVRQKSQARYEALSSVIEDLESKLSFDLFYQYVQAIRSRVLEIPHEEDGDDFVTNSTLVPFLDFANHAENPNAHFDVDRKTGAIVLEMDKSAIVGDSPFEVTISYHPTNLIPLFINSYGFIPQSDKQVLPMKLPGQLVNQLINEFKSTDQRYDLISKWLHIPLQVELVMSNGTVDVSLTNNTVPLLFIDGLQYFDKWSDEHEDVKNAITSAYKYEDINQIVALIKHQEQQPEQEIIAGVGCLGVTYNNGQQYIDRDAILEQTGNDTAEAWADLVQQTILLVVAVAKSQLQTADSQLAQSGPLKEYHRAKRHILSTFVDQHS